jgi:hypothetical protein
MAKPQKTKDKDERFLNNARASLSVSIRFRQAAY